MNLIEKWEGGDVTADQLENFQIRWIPFTSVGNQNGMLVGVKVEKVELYYQDKREMLDQVIIGVYQGSLSKNQSYHALVGLDFLEAGSEKKEKELSYQE